MTTVTPHRPDADSPATTRPRASGRSRSPIRQRGVWLHRWLSLACGLLLAVVTTSGALLVFQPELTKLSNAQSIQTLTNPRVSFADAVATVRREYPDQKVSHVLAVGDSIVVGDPATSTGWAVDARHGNVTGRYHYVPAWLSFLQNLHTCALSCENRVGYVAWLNAEIPGSDVVNFGKPLRVSNVLLGGLGLGLLLAAVTGLWVWFPRPGRWKSALHLRMSKGRFARDTDLHKIVGLVALPLLLVWGWTGAGFELAGVKQAWYAITATTPRVTPESPKVPAKAKVLSVGEAVERVQAAVPEATIRSFTVPDPAKTASHYVFRFSRPGLDAMAASVNQGDARVSVNRVTGDVWATRNAPGDPTGQYLWEVWNYPLHTGFFAPWYVRIVWFVVGLAPLALAITGLSTWLIRRNSARARGRARASA